MVINWKEKLISYMSIYYIYYIWDTVKIYKFYKYFNINDMIVFDVIL